MRRAPSLVGSRPVARGFHRRDSAPRWAFLQGLVLALLLVPLAAAAQFTLDTGITSELNIGGADLRTTLINILRWVLGILALVAVSVIIYGGVLWMTARGDQQRILKAKKVIASAVIGLIIVLLAFAIVQFVVGAAGNFTNAGPGGGGGGPPGTLTRDFEIRAITTACGDPTTTFRQDVFLCSAVTITFNNRLATGPVGSAVANGTLAIEECTDPTCTSAVSPTSDPSIVNPVYSTSNPTTTQAEWVTPQIGGREGKSLVFYHIHQNFKPTTWYRIRIPKTLTDVSSPPHQLRHCRPSVSSVTPLDGCTDEGSYFQWTFETGTRTDLVKPVVSSTVPDSRYVTNPVRFDPDRSVNRTPIITAQFSEAIDPGSLTNSLVLTEITVPTDVGAGTGYSPVAPVDPTDYTVYPTALGIEVKLRDGLFLKSFTWYEVRVQNLRDLCQNVMDPYTFVFETNDVVPGVASVYPANDYQFACPNTDIQIGFTVSMYDPEHSNCLVDPTGTDPNGGFVREGLLEPAVASRQFEVVPEDVFPGGSADPNRYCQRYAFRPTAGLLQPNQTYRVGVNTRFVINEQRETLNFGDLAAAPSAGPWHFDVRPPGACADAPFIERLNPRRGPQGQCFTVIGQNFDPGNDGQGPNDELRFGGSVIPPADILGWSPNNIVTSAPAQPPNPYDVQVRVEYPAPFGVLESNTVPFEIEAGDPSTGPCLASIHPSSGPWHTLVDLRGTRFGAADPANNHVRFTGSPTGQMPYRTWSDTFINDGEVIDNSGSGDISVQRGAEESNAMFFTTFLPIPGQPRIANWWPTCQAACVNAEAGARFDEDLDPASVNSTTVILESCTDNTCQTFTSPRPTYTLRMTAPSNEFAIVPSASLERNHWYRVILLGGSSGIRSTSLQPLAASQLNYDADPNPGNDAFSWTFRTKDDPSDCSLGSVSLTPSPSVTLRLNQSVGLRASAYGSPDSCDAGGQTLNASRFAWTWTTTNAANVSVGNLDTNGDGRTDPTQTAVAQAAPASEQIAAATDGFNASTTVNVTADPTFCRTSADCAINEVGQACDSRCTNNRCTPALNNVQPPSQPVGDWVTVQGCWFGSYGPGSQLTFLGPPSVAAGALPAQCGSPADTWKNYEVVRAVPPGAANGPLRLTRDDSRSDTTDGPTTPLVTGFPTTGSTPALPDFVVDSSPPGPKLCRIDPDRGRAGDPDELIGADFDPAGDGRGSGERATYHNGLDVVTYASWQDQSIQVTVPASVETGPVTVTTAAGTSNPLTYTALGGGGPGPGGCATSCTIDSQCSVGQGCSSSGCCAPQPIVEPGSNQPRNPPAVCRNGVVSARFAGAPIDRSTLTTTSVRLSEVGGSALTNLRLETTSTGFRLIPRTLLRANTSYRVQLLDLIRSTAGVRLGGLNADLDTDGTLDAFSWDFTTGDSVCSLDRLVVDPASRTFNRIVAPGNTQTFSALAFAGAFEIFPVDGVYDWDWSWSLSSAGPVTIPVNSTASQVLATAVQEGATSLVITAREQSPADGFRGSRSASAQLRVLVCDNPWQARSHTGSLLTDEAGVFRDSASNCNPALGGTCNDYHFQLEYCRGKTGTQLLPDLSQSIIRGVSGSGVNARLKEFIFKEPSADAKDGVGLLVFANPEGLAPREWLDRVMPGEGLGGQSTVVDGYPAYRLGTTTYVAATRLDTLATSCTNQVNNGGFESFSGSSFPSWNNKPAQPPRQDTEKAPLSLGSFSATMDASGATTSGQWYLTQIVSPADTTNHIFRVQAWVRARKVANVAGAANQAGLITQCVNTSGNPDFVQCDRTRALTTYDLYGFAPGLFVNQPVGFDSGWRRLDFTVSNPSRLTIGLQANCFAEPGWQVWCDDVEVRELTTSCASGTLAQNIYLLSYNDDASPAVKEIQERLLRSWQLNTHPGLSPEDRVAIVRDTQRLGDLQTIKQRITEHLSRGRPLPDLLGGTFTPNLSTSRWLSWSATLGSALGAPLPQDPLNNFDPACTAAGFEAASCWNETAKQFRCPVNSHVYAYRFRSPASYTLGANLEYAGPGSLRGSQQDLCNDPAQAPSECACFSYTIDGP